MFACGSGKRRRTVHHWTPYRQRTRNLQKHTSWTCKKTHFCVCGQCVSMCWGDQGSECLHAVPEKGDGQCANEHLIGNEHVTHKNTHLKQKHVCACAMRLWSGKGKGGESRKKGGEHKPQLPHRIHKIARMQQHQPAICTKVFIQQIRIHWSSIKCSLAKTILSQFTLQKQSATSNQPEVAQRADYRRTT